jgi:hypothetical protein
MPFSNTHTINFISNDYIESKPRFAQSDVQYPGSLKFSTKTIKLDLGTEDYGYVSMEVSYSGNIQYASVAFYTENGEDVSVGKNFTDLFLISNKNVILENIVLGNTTSGTKTFYIVVNPNQLNKSRFLTIEVSVGALSAPTSSSVTLSYECPTPINVYTTGLHVYSAYDARPGSSVLTTKLYSFVPIDQWVVNTVVFMNPTLKDPALPYYYGYGTKVYKVGGEFDRAFGTVLSYTVRKKLFGKPKITTNTDGPRLFTGNTTNSSEACVIPFMEDVGVIKQILNVSSLPQPQLYRYYMGYDPTNKTLSNDSVFSKYSLTTQKHEPIVGSTHALEKMSQGIVTGYRSFLKFDSYTALISAWGLGAAYLTREVIYNKIAGAVTEFLLDKLIGPFLEKVIGIAITTAVTNTILAILSGIGYLMLAYSLYKLLFKFITIQINEPCKVFIHHFTTTPYINNGSVLYRTPTPSVRNTGFFCDGVYYYQQTGTATNATVTLKEVSCTNALLSEDPLQYSRQCSLQADVPTLVVEKTKLIVLPYTSGKPLPFCGGTTIFYNTEVSQVVTNTCCALETCNSFTIRIPAAQEYSCISQADAQLKAQTKLTKAVQLAQAQGVYVTPFEESRIGTLDTYFTHQLKIEDIPTEVTVYYDSTLTGAVVGKPLYFDSSGCNKVLDGYYAVSGTTPYRKFYHTTNGVIDTIYDMTSSSSTTTTTGQPILTTNKDYSSNWYLTGVSENELVVYSQTIGNSRTFDPNSLYTSPAMKKGFIKTPTTKNNFQIFTNFVSTTHAEAESGAYQPLVDWITQEPFYYNRARTISLNLLESNYCTDATIPRGFYIIGKESNVEVSTLNEVSLLIRILTTNGNLITTLKVKTSSSSPRTFIPYGTSVPTNTPVNTLEITSIDSPNPQNNITYTVGTVTMCAGTLCNFGLSVSVVATTQPGLSNGSATVTAFNGVPPYTFRYNTGLVQTNNSTSTITGLRSETNYNVTVTDSTGCSRSRSFYVGNQTNSFIADHIVLQIVWENANDLDIRVRMASPDIGMDKLITRKNICIIDPWCYNNDAADAYVGYKYQNYYPIITTRRSATGHTQNILSWAGDNERDGGVGLFEDVYINVVKFKELYPSATGFTIDCRAFWYSTFVSNVGVKVYASLYKGGSIFWDNSINFSRYLASNPTRSIFQLGFGDPGKEVQARRVFGADSGPIRGDRVATFKYDLITGNAIIDYDDTTTPAP